MKVWQICRAGGADSEKPGTHLLAHWLDQYRKGLTSPASGQQDAVDGAGPLVHGDRLNSSRDPAAYQKIIYARRLGVSHAAHDDAGPCHEKIPTNVYRASACMVESHRYAH